jgi:hypothetical protein
MPYTGKEHESQTILTLDNFTGGMNQSVLPSLVEGNEVYEMTNMFLDPRSGRPRTRFPLDRYSASAATNKFGAAHLNGLYNWNGTLFITDTVESLFYLDGSLAPVNIGGLTGYSRPVFAPYHGKLIIASGGAIQQETNYTDPITSATLSNVSGGVTATVVFERYTRLTATGDTSYPDRIYECAYEDETDWTSEDYGDVGLQDGLSIIGITEAFDGLYIVFKRGYGGLRTYYASALSAASPTANLAAEGHAAISHHGVVHAMGKIFLMERNIVSALTGSDTQGSILYDSTPGLKLPSSFTAKTEVDQPGLSGFAVLYPRDYQIWFVPDPAGAKTVYVYHYLRNAWSQFTFNRYIYSAYYDPVGDYLYLGCDDGYVYRYNHAATSYVDDDGVSTHAYTQTLTTKQFCAAERELVLKSPSVMIEDIAAGSGKLYMYPDYATSSPQDWGTVTISGTSGRQSYRMDYDRSCDAFQFSLVMTSGAYYLDRIVANIGEGRRMRY